MTLFDKDGYPTAYALRRIRRWSYKDLTGLMAFVHGIWFPQGEPYGWKQRGKVYWLSTGGWSGNESIIKALKQNLMFWSLCWRVSWVGGHYKFHLRRLAKS